MSRRQSSSKRKALLTGILLFTFLAAGFASVLLWVVVDKETALAGQIRQRLGMERAEPEPEALSPELPDPELMFSSAREPLPKLPEPEISESVPTEPEPVVLGFDDLVEQRRLWPRTLEITVETRIPVLFNGTDYGYLEFVPGETIRVEALTSPGQIFGVVNGNYLSVAAAQTNLVEWISDAFTVPYILELEAASASERGEERSSGPFPRSEFMAEMRYWCYNNFGASVFKVTEDSLVLEWAPGDDQWSSLDFRAEARDVAEHYLRRQAALGGEDNYAACEIRHPDTDELLGSGSVYILTFADPPGGK